MFAFAAYAKLTTPRGFPAALVGFLSAVGGHRFLAYDWFLTAVVIPHAGAFAIAVIAGEMLVAVGMLSGVGTRAAAALAIVLLANYAAAKGMPVWSPASNDVADIVLALVVLAGPASAPVWRRRPSLSRSS